MQISSILRFSWSILVTCCVDLRTSQESDIICVASCTPVLYLDSPDLWYYSVFFAECETLHIRLSYPGLTKSLHWRAPQCQVQLMLLTPHVRQIKFAKFLVGHTPRLSPVAHM